MVKASDLYYVGVESGGIDHETIGQMSGEGENFLLDASDGSVCSIPTVSTRNA